MKKNEQYAEFTFVNSEVFENAWKKLNMNDDDLRKLCIEVGEGWMNHDVIEGTGGLHKFRFSSANDNRGKSGSYRVLYLPLEQDGLVYLLIIFPKSSQANVDKSQKAALKSRVDSIKKDVRKNRK